MKRIFVYAGYYELYITDKEIKGLTCVTEFDNVPDAENYVIEKDDYFFIDRDLLKESTFCWDGEDYDTHTFNFNELFLVA